ncbi:hypothetical protein [Candidatus Scalindua japonica]|nr:hypothetical protein [Candidatus Scalindua japonica]
MRKSIYKRASKLPESSQDAIAAIVLEKLKDEKRWEVSFSNSQESLSELAPGVRKEIEEEKTLPFDPASRNK